MLDAQPAHTFYTDAPSPPTPPLLLKLESAAHQAAGLGARVQRSPAPNHVSGAAAALLTRAEYGGVAAAAYLTLQDTQDVSGASLAAFAPIVQVRPRPPPCALQPSAAPVLRWRCADFVALACCDRSMGWE